MTKSRRIAAFMPLQRAILDGFPFYSIISNRRKLKRHECRDPTRSARNFVNGPDAGGAI